MNHIKILEKYAGILGLIVLVVFLGATVAGGQGAADTKSDEAWKALREGKAMAMIRHAIAPGKTEPEGFKLGDCSTQRNLSDEGKIQAGLIGDLFRKKGISSARMFSSQYCRAIDTAKLMNLGPITEIAVLNLQDVPKEERAQQNEELAKFAASLPEGLPVVMVSHQFNVSDMMDVIPRSGEIVIFTISRDAKKVEVLGKFSALD